MLPPASDSASPPSSLLTPDERMLIDFLRDHDAACPVCGYNVRALTRPLCPECRHPLVLTVGTAHLQLGWLLVTLAPGFFSGIAACFLLIPIVAMYIDSRSYEPAILVLDAFGWSSGILALALAFKRHRFLALTRSQQRKWALTTWAVHATAFLILVLYATMFF